MRVPPLLCGGFLFALCAVAGPTLDARPVAPLAVILIADSRVSPTARDTLIDEASRIWDGAGVRLEWTSPLAPPPPARDTLRMLAVARPVMQAPANPMILGELRRPEGSRALALVSLRDAERIAARGGGWRSRLLRERHVGIVLGRAAAHEIGHYLLNTSTHADQGLMRARFDEIEFANPHSDAFELDDAQRAWVRQRLHAGLPLGPDATSR